MSRGRGADSVVSTAKEQMMSMATNRMAPRLVQSRSAAALAVPGILAVTIPLVGFLASLLLPLFAARVRSRLWPETSPMIGHLCAALAVIGLWLPAVLAVVSLGQVGSDATTWLIIPLCAPAGASLVVPALFAAAAYLVGITVSAIVRDPWPWVLGAWATPQAYWAASRWLVDFACFA
jgi:hypothetical protein